MIHNKGDLTQNINVKYVQCCNMMTDNHNNLISNNNNKYRETQRLVT